MNERLLKTLFLIFILVIAVFLRLYQFDQFPPGLYPDEAMNGNNALEALATGEFKVFYPENNGREGLFINIQALSLKFFGVNEPWALRFPSPIFGILTVLGVYFLTRELFTDKRIALLAAFLIATSFWHINFSRIGFRAITAPFWLTWALFFLLIGLRKLHNARHKLASIYLLLAGLAYGAGFHSYIAYRATPPIIGFVLLYFLITKRDAWKKTLTAALIVGIATILAVAPLFWYFYTNPGTFFGRTTQVSVFESPTPLKDLALNILKTKGMFFFAGDYNWRHNLAGRPQLFLPVGILFLAGICLAVGTLIFKRLRTREEVRHHITPIFTFLVLVLWLLCASLPVVISNEGLPHALRAILMIPPIFILSAWGGIAIYEWAKKYIGFSTLKILVAVFFVTLTIEAYHTYFVGWGPQPETQGSFAANYVELGRTLNSLPQETPKYIVVNAGGTDVRGMPMPTQTTMFITGTFLPEWQGEKNIFYILPHEVSNIPSEGLIFTID